MGILHRASFRQNKTTGVFVKCPKCLATIVCSGMRDDAPLRCPKCHYPMIRRSDLLLLIAACKNIKNAKQANCAVSILSHLSEFMPEAGTALGMLPSQLQSISLSSSERWTLLLSAYAAGDDSAMAELNEMCKNSSALYGQSLCGRCGAPRYFEKYSGGKTVCPYCQSAD